MNIVNPRPPSCSSRRGESVTTKNASIRVRTKPHVPPQVSSFAFGVSFTPPPKSPPPFAAAGKLVGDRHQ
ncbi:hypothetical protein Bca52824_049215 [Brassica carinata]|uniref:Uncharacterized protein n=1 Tax=Brassica carinata TaxID=52824 RepID=A0A8X7UV13_BRACI|nr:hypothetical protein Bca52824_049215 [Brassica carinata]